MQRSQLHRFRAGFTLVELMIALLLAGVTSVIIFALFDSTSDNFVEVDNLADTTDRLRFATERLRTDIQMAGSLMTPDSVMDPMVQPKVGSVRVAGLYPYVGWQDDTTMYGPRVAAANPYTSMDGIIVLGAFDFPTSFEVSGLNPHDTNFVVHIEAHPRGLMRLNITDPFRTSLANQETFAGTGDMISRGFLIQSMFEAHATRILRITDRQGFQQFLTFEPEGAITINDVKAPPAGERFPRLELAVSADNTSTGPKFKGMAAAGSTWEEDYGFDATPDQDVAYDAAMIDAFWYHVVQDPTNPNNMQLVRDRLCALRVLKLSREPGGVDPASALPEDCDAPNERVVIANHVADFQVWFDCSASSTGGIGVRNSWNMTWNAPNAEDDSDYDCMDSSAPAIGSVRVGHIRLALHTPNERKTLAHIGFEDATGVVADPTDEHVLLRTFDPYPTVPGAAPVVTMQTDFELPNFADRNAM